MSFQKINPRFAVLAIFIAVIAAMRILNSAGITPWSHFTPIGAMGLFGGAYFSKKWKAILFPLITLLAGDLIIQAFVFNGKYGILYSGWYWIYGIFILITFLGTWLIQKVSVKNVLTAGVAAAITHWLIADFTVWAGGGIDIRTALPLSKNWEGLVQCYVQGFPYMKNFLVGTLVYSGVLFGAFEWMKNRYSSLRIA